jgi:hypothetical protein
MVGDPHPVLLPKTGWGRFIRTPRCHFTAVGQDDEREKRIRKARM